MDTKIYVGKTENGFEEPIIDKLLSSNYKIIYKESEADYSIKCSVANAGLGRAKGSVSLIDNKTGELLGKTIGVKGQTTLFNGYANPKMISMKKIANKYLIELLQKHLK